MTKQEERKETAGERREREKQERIAAMSPEERRLHYIEEFGRLLFTREEIAIMLGESGDDMDADTTAHTKGRLMAEYEVRASILKSATTGSAPAQKQWMDLIDAQANKALDPPSEVGDMESDSARVEHLGRLQFTRREIATVIGRELDKDLLEAYKRGLLLEEAKVREAVSRMAIQGNTAAQKQYADMVAKTKKSNIGLAK